jgi:pyrimidine-nucleoside phosphorylase
MEISAPLLIRKVQNKTPLTKEEITALVRGFEQGIVPEYQMSAFLMAVYFQGLTLDEKEHLTNALLTSGHQMKWPVDKAHYVDKHSTGGTGDKTSLILAPLLAALGYKIPMMSGRGLGHTGGTLDKLESMTGLRTDLTLKEFEELTEEHGVAFIGQTKELCPADKKIYALRDVTCTVSSLPLITASIVSKKIAEGVKGLVYDVKTGSGAFIKDFEDSKELAKSLVQTSEKLGAKSVALITDMSQPLGRYVGNRCEMFECFKILENSKEHQNEFADTRELTLHLTARLMELHEPNVKYEDLFAKAKTCLESGAPLEIAKKIFKAQGWNGSYPDLHDQYEDWAPSKTGFIESMDNETIGWASVALGVGRRVITDPVDPSVGFYFYKKVADKLESGQPLVRIFYTNKEKLEKAKKLLDTAFTFTDNKPHSPQLIQDVVYGEK